MNDTEIYTVLCYRESQWKGHKAYIHDYERKTQFALFLTFTVELCCYVMMTNDLTTLPLLSREQFGA